MRGLSQARAQLLDFHPHPQHCGSSRSAVIMFYQENEVVVV